MRAGGISDEVYSAVKSFASKGTILPRSGLESLAEAKDLEDLSSRLKGTVYNDSITKLSKPYDAEKFEMAFREYLVTMHHNLIYSAPQPDLIASYFLKHIILNLKIVLKGKALGMGYDEIIRHVNLFAEELAGRRDLVVRALSAKDLDEAVTSLKTSEFGEDVISAVKLFRSDKDIQILDTYIDRAFYKSLVSSYNRLLKRRFGRIPPDAKMVRNMMAIDIDSYNTLGILRTKIWNLPPTEARNLIVEPTFDVPLKALKGIINTENITEAVKHLATTPYRRIIPIGVSEEEIIPRLEDGFELMSYEEASKTFLWQIYGLGVVLGIVKLRELEVRNLSAIAFGVEQAIGFHNIMSKLVILASSPSS